jgi:hypothetical protein
MNFWKNSGAHIVGYVLALATFLSNLPAQADFLGPNTDKYVGIAAALVVFIHQVQKQLGAKSDATKQGGYARVSLLVTIAAVATAVTGCALLANPTFDLVLQAAIQAVVDAVLAKNPLAAPILVQDATTLASLASGSTSVGALQTQADNVIAASKLPTGDKAAIEDLVAAAAGLIQQEAAKIPANAQSGLQLVFTDIANAAQLSVRATGQTKGIVLQR